MYPIKLAIISDLHVGRSARSIDLCPHENSKAVETGFRDKFLSFLKKNSITADYIIIPGDITDEADPNEFELASSFIYDIADKLGVISNNIVFVPGNHDVNWPVLKINPNDKTGVYNGLRYLPLLNENLLFSKALNNASCNLTNLPYISIWEYENAVIVGLNSSWNDDPAISIHHGIVAPESIEELKNKLERIDLSLPRLKIFVVHHHPVPYSDPLPSMPDFSIMTNAPNLLKLLQTNQFDFLIHGHKHAPHFDSLSISCGFPIGILAAGSFSSILDTRWSGCVNNQFHIIEVDGRDSTNKSTFGKVCSWSYTNASSWTCSQYHNGIHPRIPFGTYVQPNILAVHLQSIISEGFLDKNYITWSEVTNKFADYSFIPHDIIIQVLDKLSTIIGYKRHGVPPDEIILLKLGAYDE